MALRTCGLGMSLGRLAVGQPNLCFDPKLCAGAGAGARVGIVSSVGKDQCRMTFRALRGAALWKEEWSNTGRL